MRTRTTLPCLVALTAFAAAAAPAFALPASPVRGDAAPVQAAAPAPSPATAPIIGRWDLTVQGAKGPYPSWLEVYLSGSRTLVGKFVGGGGSARPIARVDFDNGSVHFAIPPQWDKDTADLVMDAKVSGDSLEGTIVTPAGERQPFTGRRAPALRRTTAPVWGKPLPLITGSDLAGWTTFGGPSQWTVEKGVLQNAKSGGNLVTTAKFDDFKLHVEVNCPKGSNSGIYLRGRYEVQVEDSAHSEPKSTDMGGVYGFLVPNENASAGSGTWQTFDITLIGRRVTVVFNGKAIILDQTIPGITGGALDSDEGAPGPIYLQGDHGPVQYRNIVITPAIGEKK
jgi:hypothetical protein